MNQTPVLLIIESVIEMTGLGRSKIYEEIGSGRLRSLKVGRRRLIAHSAVLDWIEQVDRDTPR